MKKKGLYIAGYDKAGIFRFAIPAGGKIPAGVIAGKGWTLRAEYRPYEVCECGEPEHAGPCA